MGTFNSVRFISTSMTDFSEVADMVGEQMTQQGYTYTKNASALGCSFSITKGGIFKSVLGMKTALNVDMTPMNGGVNVSAKVGVFGQQALPTVITMFVAWPVLLTQISGMVQQAKLDDEVIQKIEQCIRMRENSGPAAGYRGTAGAGPMPFQNDAAGGGSAAQQGFEFCTSCGTKVPLGSRFCNGCGAKLH